MNKTLVIHLIREQIRNQVLISSLEKMGFDCSCYAMCISEQILTMVGFKNLSDELYQRYFDLIEKASEETSYINMDEMIIKWSEHIYAELIDTKSKECATLT